ncbi:chaplin family protein [Streptodolium elevatio]
MVGGVAHADSGADGAAAGSSGVAAGNATGVPLDVPVNLCADGLRVVGVLSPTLGGVACANAPAPVETPSVTPTEPPTPPRSRVMPPPEVVQATTPPAPVSRDPGTPRPAAAPVPQAARLAETGAETSVLAATGIAFLLGGTILYRRARPVHV